MKQSQAFASTYPKLASRLMMTGESADDPHVERLIQAFSLIAARIHKKLDDGYEDFTSALFEVLYPGYLKPFPSCSIVSLEQGLKLGQLAEPMVISKGSLFTSKPYQGVSCRFKSAYSVQLLPLQIAQVVFRVNTIDESYQYTNASLKIHFSKLSEGFNYKNIFDNPLRVFLDAPAFSVARLRDTLLDSASVVFAGTSVQMAKEIVNPFKLVGFQPEDALLPLDDHAQHAYRLICEYFTFSEKFNFIDIDLAPLKNCVASHAKDFFIELRFRLDTQDSGHIKAFNQLSEKNLRLFCTPVINLFEKPAEPIRINHQQQKYHVVGDVHHPAHYEIYQLKSLSIIREDTAQKQSLSAVVPFFSMNHVGDQSAKTYYHLSRNQDADIKATGYDYQLTLVDFQFKPAEVQADFLSMDLLCTNRQLPSLIPFGLPGGDLVQDNNGPCRQVRFLRKPTPTYRFNHADDGRWRVVSHLSLNTMALTDAEDISLLKEMLSLYELPRSADNAKQIESLKKVHFKATTALVPSNPYPMFIRGLDVQVVVDAAGLAGTGIQLMGNLLSYIFSLRVSLNNFIKVILIDHVTGQELLVCNPRNGFRNLV